MKKLDSSHSRGAPVLKLRRPQDAGAGPSEVPEKADKDEAHRQGAWQPTGRPALVHGPESRWTAKGTTSQLSVELVKTESMRPAEAPATGGNPSPRGEVDSALRSALPSLFGGPSSTHISMHQLTALKEGLAPLKGALVAAGHPRGLEPLLTALGRQVSLNDLASTGTRAAREDAAAALMAWAGSILKAIGPGRDGAELVSLYGHSPALDHAIDGLRTDAMTRLMLTHEAKAQGHADSASLPVETRIAVHAASADLTKREREIAQTKQQILRAISPSKDGFAPSLNGLRFTPELAEGMRRANPATTQKAGVLICALLAKEEALAASPAGQRMLGAVKGQLESAGTDDAHYLKQRVSALAPQHPATGLSVKDTAELKLNEADAKKIQETLVSMAEKGLSGVGEIRESLAAANQTLGTVKENAGRLAPLNTAYLKAVDVERGNILASGLLARLAGVSRLHTGSDPVSNTQLRAALMRPNGPLGMIVDKNAPGRERLNALTKRYDAIAETAHRAESELRVVRLDAFSGPVDPARVRGFEATIENAHAGMKAIVAERRELMGPEVAKALDDALLAAAIKARPDTVDAARGDGLKGKIQTAFSHLVHALQTRGLAVDEAELEAHALCTVLESWGLDSHALAPEIHEMIGKPIDTKALDTAIADFTPPPGMKEQFDAEMYKLTQPGGSPRLASAALERFTKGLEVMAPGTRLAWSFDSHAEVSTPLVALSFVPVGDVRALLMASADAASQIHASRDNQGYQLVLRSGTAATAGVGLQALGTIILKYLTADATASIEAAGHDVTGVALRFPDSDVGREDMKALLGSLLANGEINVHDLSTAHEVMPIVEQRRGGNATAGVRLNASMPFGSISVRDQVVGVNADPRLHSIVTAGVQAIHTTRANARQQVQEHVEVFKVKLATDLQMRAGAGIASMGGLERALGLGSLLPDTAMESPLPVYGMKLDHLEATCRVATKDVREGGLLMGDTERTVGLSGLPKVAVDIFPRLAAAALDTVGGPELKALGAYLQASKAPEAEALRTGIASLLKAAGPNDEVRVTSRIDPKVQSEVNELLQEARATAGRQMGHAAPQAAEAAASRLEGQAKARLADTGSYRLHGLELVAHENTNADVGTWLDLRKMSLGFLSWGKRTEGAHERVFASIQIDPTILDAARHAAG